MFCKCPLKYIFPVLWGGSPKLSRPLFYDPLQPSGQKFLPDPEHLCPLNIALSHQIGKQMPLCVFSFWPQVNSAKYVKLSEGLGSVSRIVDKNLSTLWCRLKSCTVRKSTNCLVGLVDWILQNRHFACRLARIEYSELMLLCEKMSSFFDNLPEAVFLVWSQGGAIHHCGPLMFFYFSCVFWGWVLPWIFSAHFF